MECKEIVTGVRHMVRGKQRVDSFFVIDARIDEPFLLEILGECYVDGDSIINYREWMKQEWVHCTLLVSLDYKYALLRPSDETHEFFIRPGEVLLPMLPYPISGPPKEKLIPALTRELTGRVADQVRYGLRLKGRANKLPQRINFKGWQVLEFNPLSFVHFDDNKEIGDLALFWQLVAIAPENSGLRSNLISEFNYRAGTWKNDCDFLELDGLALSEIDERRARALAHIRNLNGLTYHEGFGQAAVWDYLKGIDDLDEAFELYLSSAAFYGAQEIQELLSKPREGENLGSFVDWEKPSVENFGVWFGQKSEASTMPNWQMPIAFIDWAFIQPLHWRLICQLMDKPKRARRAPEVGDGPFADPEDIDF